MPADERGSGESFHAELAAWIERLKKVDSVLEGPAISLIETGHTFLESGTSPSFPSWISQTARNTKDSLLVHSLVASTLQRLWRTRRRHAWMHKETRDRLEALQPVIVESAEALAKPLSGKTADMILALH